MEQILMFLHTYWPGLSTSVQWMSVVSYCNMALILTVHFPIHEYARNKMPAERLHFIVPCDAIR